MTITTTATATAAAAAPGAAAAAAATTTTTTTTRITIFWTIIYIPAAIADTYFRKFLGANTMTWEQWAKH